MSTNEMLRKRKLKRQKNPNPAPSSSNSNKKKNNEPNKYLKQKIMSASAERLILYIYDAAITACKKEDNVTAVNAIQELINSLDFKHNEVANTFYNTYQMLLDMLDKDKYDEAQEHLKELRTTWADAMNL